MSEINLDHKSKGPMLTCPLCQGKGSYIDPPLEVQRAEQKAGARKLIVRKVCVCIREGSSPKVGSV